MGLIGGIARTAVVAGTATAVSNRVSRRQAGRWAEQDAEYEAPTDPYAVPPPQYSGVGAPYGGPVDPMEAKLARLEQLGDLKAQGVLTEGEFETQKARILAQ